MLCNPLSFYPDKIDPLIFFQDVNLSKVEIMNTYDNLIKQGKYTEANEYINNQEGIYGYFADFLNAIENRIYNLQTHLLTIEPKQPFIYSDEEPITSAIEKENGTYRLLSYYSNADLSKYTHKELADITNNQPTVSGDIIWI